jgi:AdoMet-dependent heme synthase
MTNSLELQSHPLAAIWETNQRSGPIGGEPKLPRPPDLDLTDFEAEQMIRGVAKLNPPIFVFAGDDPLRRQGILSLVQYASACRLRPTMVLGASSKLTRPVVNDLRRAQLARVGFVLNGSTAELHDRISGVEGSFENALHGIQYAREGHLPVQVHTTVSRRNLHDLEAIAAVLKGVRVMAWHVSFLVPSGPLEYEEVPSADQFELAFARLYVLAQEVHFKIKTVDAPHYRRFVLQERSRHRHGNLVSIDREPQGIPGILPVNESRGTLFISSTGEIYPGASLRISGGNVRTDDLAEVYRNGSLFSSLRDPRNLKGKCSTCEFKDVCGGSRARAWAVAGDLFAQDDHCIYQPHVALRASCVM